MLEAKKEIFIAGWWVSPQFQMIRPLNEQNEKYRLDRIIESAASKGVKVNVIVYCESTFLENDSNWTKICFEQLNPTNVKVLRHPVTVMPFLWSHHEKLVIIDQQLAFTGGLDLCYARYDTNEHLLYDYRDDMYPGIDYNNIRKQDLVRVKEFDALQYHKTKPRLPWHDIACSVRGSIVWDLSLHFIQYWNYASHQIELNNKNVLVREAKTPAGRVKMKFDEGMDKMKELADKFRDKFRRKEEAPNRFEKYFEEIKGEENITEVEPPPSRFPNISIGANRIYDMFATKGRLSVQGSSQSPVLDQRRIHGSLSEIPEDR
jgi:phospholipase D1/2